MMRIAQPAGAELNQSGLDVPTLLLIESEQVERQLVRDVLAGSHGMLQVDHVSSLAEGLDRLAKHDVRAVLRRLVVAGVPGLCPRLMSFVVWRQLRRS